MHPLRLSALVVSAVLILSVAALTKQIGWRKPITELYYSGDSAYCIEVVPARIFPDPAKPCHARLFRKSEHGDTLIQWERDLPNPVAPGNAIVSPTGRYVVTFNDWRPGGFPDNAVVIYDSVGQCITKLALRDFQSEHDPADLQKYLDTSHPHIWIEDQPAPNNYSNTGNHIDEANDLLTLYTLMDFGASDYYGLTARDTVRVDLKTGRVLTPVLRKPGARQRTGDTLWTRSYPSRIMGSTTVSSSDGITALFGRLPDGHSGIGKIDRNGELQWVMKNDTWNTEGVAVTGSHDGEVTALCAGYEDKNGHHGALGCIEATVFGVGSNGAELWNSAWDIPNANESIFGLARTPSGDLIASGRYELYGAPPVGGPCLYLKRMVVLKHEGQILHDWLNSYTNPLVGMHAKMLLATDSTLLISGGETGNLAKFAVSGKPLWVDTLNLSIYDLTPLTSGSCAVVVCENDTSFVLRITADGLVLSRHRLSLRPSDQVCAITTTRAGGYAFAVRGSRFAEGGEFVLLITDREGHTLRESQAGTFWDENPVALIELKEGFLMAGNNEQGLYAVLFRH